MRPTVPKLPPNCCCMTKRAIAAASIWCSSKNSGMCSRIAFQLNPQSLFLTVSVCFEALYMSCVIVSAKKLIGRIEPPPYKSEVIRLLILAGLCGIRPAEFVHLPNNCGEDIKNAVIAVNEAFLIPMPKAEKHPLFRFMSENPQRC